MILVEIKTKLGSIVIEVYDDRAPKTSKHFLAYVDSGYYNGSAFYRSARSADNEAPRDIRINVIQAGFYNDNDKQALLAFDKNPPIDDTLMHAGARPQIMVEPTSETGVRHIDGAISMARGTPDSVDDSFFICIGDQPELDAGGKRNPDGIGFPAFGKVISGMDIVLKINAMPTIGQKLINDVEIIKIARV